MGVTRSLHTLPKAKAYLIVHGGPNDGAMLRLRAKELIVGKDPKKSDLSLDDRTISGEHISIRPDGDTFTVTDMASRNGTLVNGKSVHDVHLNDGDVIKIGHTILIYKYIPSHAGRV